MHDWSDKNVDWDGINEAATFVEQYCRTWGRIGGQAKEKYGTVRFYASMGYLSLHGIVYPGYVYNQFPNWLWTLDCYYISRFLNFFFGGILTKWQMFIYRRSYKLALKKWPHLREEILSCADYDELLEGL